MALVLENYDKSIVLSTSILTIYGAYVITKPSKPAEVSSYRRKVRYLSHLKYLKDF